MPRYFYGVFLAVAVAGLAFAFVYSTQMPPAESTEQTERTAPTAELGGVSLKIDYATTSEAREQGLGGRTEIPENYGMLFVFPKDDYYGFWAKDMLVPIDIFWLNDKGQVIYLVSDVDPSSYPDVFYPTEPALYVLETAAGFAREHAIETGTLFLLKNFPIVSE